MDEPFYWKRLRRAVLPLSSCQQHLMLVWSCDGLAKAPSASCPASCQLQGFRSLCHRGQHNINHGMLQKQHLLLCLFNRISAKARANLQLSSRGAVCRLGLGLGVTQLAEHLCPQIWSFPTSCLLDFSILQKYLKSKLKVCAQQHDTGHGFL